MVESGQHDFDNARATSFYRYLLPAFRDLYGVDFDTITDEQARELNDRIFANYQDDKWLIDVITRRANIELMLIDPYWARLQFGRAYKFSVPVLNVTEIMMRLAPGSHGRQRQPLSSGDSGAGTKIETLDDYLAALEKIFEGPWRPTPLVSRARRPISARCTTKTCRASGPRPPSAKPRT